MPAYYFLLSMDLESRPVSIQVDNYIFYGVEGCMCELHLLYSFSQIFTSQVDKCDNLLLILGDPGQYQLPQKLTESPIKAST